MAKEFDPNNLSGGDVLRAIAPLVAIIAIFVLVIRYAPDYVWLLFLILIAGATYWAFTLPKKDLEAIQKSHEDQQEKIARIPVVGPVLAPVVRLLGGLSSLVTLATFAYFIYWSIKKLMQ